MADFILVIAGTNRPGANALKVAHLLLGHYRSAGIEADLLSLADLPVSMFSPEAYAAKPPAVAAMQQRILEAAGLHIVTPEYNGSFPGVLKYFIDMLKFPESFEGKPVAFVGEAAGIWGALRPVEQLQQIFAYRSAHLYPERVFIPGIGQQKLSAEGKLLDADIDQRLSAQTRGFGAFVKHLKKI